MQFLHPTAAKIILVVFAAMIFIVLLEVTPLKHMLPSCRDTNFGFCIERR